MNFIKNKIHAYQYIFSKFKTDFLYVPTLRKKILLTLLQTLWSFILVTLNIYFSRANFILSVKVNIYLNFINIM